MNEPDRFTPETVGRVVRWAILIFLTYIFIQHMWPYVPNIVPVDPAKQEKPHPVVQTTPNTEPTDCSGNVFNNFSLFAAPLFPVTSARVAISDITPGTGQTAMCGQKANLRYTYAQRGGDIIFNNMEQGPETKDLILGSRELLPGLERGIIGMKVGGERDITIPPALGFAGVTKITTLRDHDKFKFGGITGFVTARAKLISLSPELPESAFKLRMIEQSLGEGQDYECGDEIAITLSLWKMDGTRLYSNEEGIPLRFTIGASQVPFGIEQGVLGMMMDGKRTLIIPPAYTKPLLGSDETSLLKDANINGDEMLLATIQVVALTPAKTADVPAPVETTPTEPKE